MDRNHEGERVMTRKEVAEKLKSLWYFLTNNDYPQKDLDALRVAIKALEQEPKLQSALEQAKGAYNALVANVHCNDCISRAEAINAISHAEVNFTVTSKIDFADYKREIQEIVDHIVEAQVKALNDLPSVTPQQKVGKWIPISERLPEKRGDYLVTQKATFTDYVYISVAGYALNLHDVDEYDFADKKRAGWYEYDSEWGYFEIDGVIAWMPLPKPYKAESKDEEAKP